MSMDMNDIWDDANNAVCQSMQENKMCNCPDGECLAAKVEPSAQDQQRWNTRTTPSADPLAGLQRYTFMKRDGLLSSVDPTSYGRYVLHSEASQIITEQAAVIEKLNEQNDKFKWQVRDTCTRAEAAEGKLAQIEKQNPVGYILDTKLFELQEDEIEAIVTFIRKKPYEIASGTPLYAAPVASEADLKAENERLRAALKPLVDHAKERNAEGLEWLNSDTVRIPVTIGELRSALNVEASHDKG